MFQNINRIFMFVNIALGVILGLLTFIDFETVGEAAICDRCWPVGAFIGWSYVLLFLTVLAAVAGAVLSAVVNPKGIRGTAIGIGAMLLVIVVSYLLASDEIMKGYSDDITASVSRWSGAGLYAFYILFVMAVLSIVYSAVSRALK